MKAPDDPRWRERPLTDLLQEIVTGPFPRLRAALARLVSEAARFEAEGPPDLSEAIGGLARSLEEHLTKEEEVLFPLIRAGRVRAAALGIRAMTVEHEDHRRALDRLAVLLAPPPSARAPSPALYDALVALDEALRRQMALENEVVFPRALTG